MRLARTFNAFKGGIMSRGVVALLVFAASIKDQRAEFSVVPQCEDPHGEVQMGNGYSYCAERSICSVGCGLCSMVSILLNYGITTLPNGAQVNPLNLNSYMQRHRAYAYCRKIPYSRFDSLTQVARAFNNGVALVQDKSCSGDGCLADDVLDAVINGEPVLLLVNGLTSSLPWHWVTAYTFQPILVPPYWDLWVADSGEYGEPYKLLRTQFGGTWHQAVFFRPTSSGWRDMPIQRLGEASHSSLVLITNDDGPSSLLVNPDGLRTGEDASGAVLEEIPDATFEPDPGLDDDSGQGLPRDPGASSIIIHAPEEGTYTVELAGAPDTPYVLHLERTDAQGDAVIEEVSGALSSLGRDTRYFTHDADLRLTELQGMGAAFADLLDRLVVAVSENPRSIEISELDLSSTLTVILGSSIPQLDVRPGSVVHVAGDLVPPGGFNGTTGLNATDVVVVPSSNKANSPPVATDDHFATSRGTPIALGTQELLANDHDPESDPMSVVAAGMVNSSQGTVVLSGGVVTFMPAPEFSGRAAIRYAVYDGNGGLSIGRADIDVGPVLGGGEPLDLLAPGNLGDFWFALAADGQGRIYTGNNSNGCGGPTIQRIDPSVFEGEALSFEAIGPIVGDADGLTVGSGSIFAPDMCSGVRSIPVDTPQEDTLLPISTNTYGSPLAFSESDEHLFVGDGYSGQSIREYDLSGDLLATYSVAGVETMSLDPLTRRLAYAQFSAWGDVRMFTPITGLDGSLSPFHSSQYIIDGGLTFDRCSGQVFTCASFSSDGAVERIEPSGRVRPVATNVFGCNGILREPVSGDLFVLEDRKNLYRIPSSLLPPGGVDTVAVAKLPGQVAELTWMPERDATAYDVIRGSLSLLRSTAGDFAAATEPCLSENQVGTRLEDASVPAPGDGFWYLLRGETLGGSGSYDSLRSCPPPPSNGSHPGQDEPRDVSIRSSGGDCNID